jgi:hypothetical protein
MLRLGLSVLAIATVASTAAVPLTAAGVPIVESIPAVTRSDAQAKRIRYGPIKVPAAADGLVGSNMPYFVNAQGPCTDCTILRIRASFEHTDGTDAPSPETFTHHVALAISGKSVLDSTCGLSNSTIIYNVGNERAPILFTNDALKLNSGYYVNAEDSFIVNTLLMNPHATEQNLYAVFDYDYLPGKQASFSNVHPVWLNVAQGNCTGDDTETTRAVGDFPPPTKDTFSVSSGKWISPYDGTLIGASKFSNAL